MPCYLCSMLSDNMQSTQKPYIPGDSPWVVRNHGCDLHEWYRFTDHCQISVQHGEIHQICTIWQSNYLFGVVVCEMIPKYSSWTLQGHFPSETKRERRLYTNLRPSYLYWDIFPQCTLPVRFRSSQAQGKQDCAKHWFLFLFVGSCSGFQVQNNKYSL